MKCWYQFSDVNASMFGFGTEQQARRFLDQRNSQRAVNHFTMTMLDKGEEPVAEGLVVDLDSGITLPTRYKRREPSS